jgi:hypothetical protein
VRNGIIRSSSAAVFAAAAIITTAGAAGAAPVTSAATSVSERPASQYAPLTYHWFIYSYYPTYNQCADAGGFLKAMNLAKYVYCDGPHADHLNTYALHVFADG